MKNYDVYVGTIRKCINVDGYKKYGNINNEINEYNDGEVFARVYEADAILLKAKNGYVWLKDVTNAVEETLTELGVFNKALPDYPLNDDDLFVEINSLRPFYMDDEKKNVKIKQIKRNPHANSYRGNYRK